MKPRILFVDDEAPIRELLALYFRKKGYEVVTAITGREGIDAAGREPFDLAILDINLAGENGLTVLEHLKRQRPGMPVIMFTGMADDGELLEQSKAKGADGFMRKTESLDQLHAVVRQFVPKP